MNTRNANKAELQTIEEYVSGFPKEVQRVWKIRKTISKPAPEAEEVIRYQMPTFKLAGNLIHFAAFKKHRGFYPTPSGIEQFKEELAGYEDAKGSVQFPLDKPVPLNLIGKIVKFRLKENLERAATKRKRS